ncbi:MAG: hypothetical protein ACOZCL_00965 [Bacillota bacterium]
MSKKVLISIILVIALVSQGALAHAEGTVPSAKVGDIIGNVLETDIVAKINGYKIPSVNIDGYMAVYAADLRNYGFDVIWDEEARTVQISFNPDKSFTPMTVADKVYVIVGKKLGNILYTDIKTYFPTREIGAFNLDNRTAIYFKDLVDFGVVEYNNDTRTSSLTVKSNTAGSVYHPVPELLVDDNELWARTDIKNLVSTYYFTADPENKRLIYTFEPYYKDYILDETYNPEINKQVYNLVKSQIEDGFFVGSTLVTDVPMNGYESGNLVHVWLSKDSVYGMNNSYYFAFTFFENNNLELSRLDKNFSDNSFVKLDLSRLWWERDDEGNLYMPSMSGWVVEKYAVKLKKSLMTLFGEETGKQLYDYVVDIYEKQRTTDDYNNKSFTKVIDGVQIDLQTDDSARLNFYFSFLK